ncbi:MAG: DUF6049 family protein, partial [Actinomycetota bacterium]|nr:DUF6049 family protein [Actinomycetota bacterium]
AFARHLTDQVDAIESGVELVKPTTGTYTLASSNSPLPVTIINHLNVQVTVRISVTTKNGLPGFTAPDSGTRTIAAGNRVIAQIPTHVDRAGRFKVEVSLLTPSGAQIDQPLDLSVRSTALGAIGVMITVVAAVVLALALLIRLMRRLCNGPTPPDPELAVLK